MSDRFRNTLKVVGASALALLLFYTWLYHHIEKVVRDKYPTQHPQAILKPGIKEEITFNPNKHEVTVTTPSGTTTQYSRGGRVDITDSGKVVVDSRKFGFERVSFMGAGYGGDSARLYLGADLGYVYKTDLFAAVGVGTQAHLIQPLVGLSWNFYSNSSLDIGINPASFLVSPILEYGVFVAVRL